jgi:hypothetical protein
MKRTCGQLSLLEWEEELTPLPDDIALQILVQWSGEPHKIQNAKDYNELFVERMLISKRYIAGMDAFIRTQIHHIAEHMLKKMPTQRLLIFGGLNHVVLCSEHIHTHGTEYDITIGDVYGSVISEKELMTFKDLNSLKMKSYTTKNLWYIYNGQNFMVNLVKLDLCVDTIHISLYKSVLHHKIMPALKILNIDFGYITKRKLLSNLTNLEELSIVDSIIVDDGVLSSMHQLKVFRLKSHHSDSEVTNIGIKSLTNLKTLCLNVPMNENINDAGFKHLTNLENLSGFELDITGDGLGQMTALKSLWLSFCVGIDDYNVFSKLGKLTHLGIHYCDSIQNIGTIPLLKHLSLRGEFFDNTCSTILERFPLIEEVDISHTKRLNLQFNNSPSLKYIGIKGVRDVYPDCLKGLDGVVINRDGMQLSPDGLSLVKVKRRKFDFLVV